MLRLLRLMLRGLGLLMRVACCPLIWLIGLGDGSWYRSQRRSLVDERPGLTHGAYLAEVGAAADEELVWLAVREAMADSIGVPSSAIRPEDRVADLFRMQWVGPDLLDIIFRVERLVGVKVPRAAIDAAWQDRLETFGAFAAAFVRGVRGLSRFEGWGATVKRSGSEASGCLAGHLLLGCFEEMIGRGSVKRRLVDDRPPLDDDGYLAAVRAGSHDAPVWRAIRQALADCLDLPPVAIRPEDRLDDLRRVAWGGFPNALEMVLRVERLLGRKVPWAVADTIRDQEPKTFGQLAEMFVSGM